MNMIKLNVIQIEESVGNREPILINMDHVSKIEKRFVHDIENETIVEEGCNITLPNQKAIISVTASFDDVVELLDLIQ